MQSTLLNTSSTWKLPRKPQKVETLSLRHRATEKFRRLTTTFDHLNLVEMRWTFRQRVFWRKSHAHLFMCREDRPNLHSRANLN